MNGFVIAALGVLAVTAVSAQSMPECKGQFEVIRMDQIKPGKMDAFRKAVADHQAWYKSHGAKDKIIFARIITPGAAPAYAPDQAMSVHIETEAGGDLPHDAAWGAFVAEYKDSSTVTSTTIACVEDGAK